MLILTQPNFQKTILTDLPPQTENVRVNLFRRDVLRRVRVRPADVKLRLNKLLKAKKIRVLEQSRQVMQAASAKQAAELVLTIREVPRLIPSLKLLPQLVHRHKGFRKDGYPMRRDE